MDAAALFENTMDWLRDSYEEHRFFVERDIVWTAQLRLLQEVERAKLPCRVLNDYTLFERTRADLAILNGGAVEVAAEFKYEPARARSGEFGGGKFPVVEWRSVEKDVLRVRDYVAQGKAKTAYAVFIDEGGHFAGGAPHPGSEWRDWGNGVWALWTKVGGDAAYKAPPAGGACDALSSGEHLQIAAPGEWVLLPHLNVNLPAYAPPPVGVRFPDGSERPVNSWKDLLFGVASWLASVGELAERDAPVPVDARQPRTRQRYIVSAAPVHGSGKPFEEPFEIPGAPLFVETMVDKTQAKSHAIKLLEHCEVDPTSVFALR